MLTRLSAWNVRRLMRIHRITIRDLATRMNITMKRVREVRAAGVTGSCMSLDWYEAITGTGIFASASSQQSASTDSPARQLYL